MQKFGKEDIFRPTFGNGCLCQDSNDNGVRTVNFATSKNLVFKISTFPHSDIHKYILTSPEGKTHNQTDHVLDRRWHSRTVDLFSGNLTVIPITIWRLQNEGKTGSK
jgi:hypothetical protein